MSLAIMPRRLRDRPRDQRGFLIPFNVLILPDGTPDFRASDPDRWLRCVNRRLCSMCGEGLGPGAWFIGGPLCHEHRLFQDPAMHQDCAEFALRVCPFLAIPKAHFSDLERRPPPPGMREIPIVENGKPDRFMLGRTRTFAIRPVEGVPFIQAGSWTIVHWWKDGEPLSRRE